MKKPGLVLIFFGILAMVLSNSPLSEYYFAVIQTKNPINVLFLVNDVLMTIFFLDVGLEIKHQIVVGHLSKLRQIFLPTFAAIGGVIVPALIFIGLNINHPEAMHGWAIPTATDIAFALGIIILLGDRIPLELRVLLLTIAVIDDLSAILIIAVAYSSNINIYFLMIALAATIILALTNYFGSKNIVHYVLLGGVLWYCMLKAGIHPTLGGVITALAIPLSTRQTFHKHLYISVSYIILPLFALTNAGIYLGKISFSHLLEPVTIGILLGLLVGKPVGVFGFSYIACKLKIAVLPHKISWPQLYGMSILCGIGFTMSVFIGNLAFDSDDLVQNMKLGVLLASTISAIYGYWFMRCIPLKENKILKS